MTIPASDIVVVNPGVVSSGGSPLVLNGVMVSKNALLPTGRSTSFASAAAVSAFFGPSSAEYAQALIYFAGFDNSTVKPALLIFAPYADAARAAWVQSGSLAALSLTQLQALSGTLIVTVDGVVFTSSSINLTGVASFSAAATAITAGFTGVGKPTCTWNAVNSTFTLTSSTTGVTSTIGAVTGTLAAGLNFTAALGAIMSQGAAVDTPTTAMDTLKASTQNWASFMTLWEPVTADKQLFAAWTTAQNLRYVYVAWDTDAQAIVNNSSTCFGALAKSLKYNAVLTVYNTVELATFALGAIASVDFERPDGRITIAFKGQGGLASTVTDQNIANILLANGYNFYGTYATASQDFTFFYNGQISGDWLWLDPYINQIYLNAQFQLALMNLLTTVKSIPYNQNGYGLIRAAMLDPINSALSFGSIRTGVTLSASQTAQVNQAAGLDVAPLIQQQGYYLQIIDPSAQVRANRGTPVINFWYTDGGAVQKIVVSSVDLM